MSDVLLIPVDNLVRRIDTRMQDDVALAALADSIAEVGLMNPLTVRQTSDDRFEIIAGSHRFAACDLLEWSEVPCRVVQLDDTRAELAMIDENLCRAELRGVLRDQQMARRKELYETLHADTRHGGARASRQLGDLKEADRFTAETAALTGRSERSIQRSAERGAKVAPETANLIQGTRLDTGTYADRLKDLTPEEQVEQVRRDLASPLTPRPPATLGPMPSKNDAFTRFIELVDEIEALGTGNILSAAGPQRSTLGQRASGLASMMDNILEGLADA